MLTLLSHWIIRLSHAITAPEVEPSGSLKFSQACAVVLSTRSDQIASGRRSGCTADCIYEMAAAPHEGLLQSRHSNFESAAGHLA